MVEFITFFLTLVTGTIPVQLEAVGPVATIEIRLDGELAQTLETEPWNLEIDLGAELRPHKLEAIARDPDGGEVDRAVRWINLAAKNSGAALILESGDDGQPNAARLEWEGVGFRRPESLEVSFDGQPLAVTDPRHISLPRYRPGFHFVEASIRFPDSTQRLTASFGGAYGDELTSELTALPVIQRGQGKLAAKKLRGNVLYEGQALEVHDTEKDVAELVIVRDPAAEKDIRKMADHFLKSATVGRPALGKSSRREEIRNEMQEVALFSEATHLSFTSPIALPARTGMPGNKRAFASSADLPVDREGLLWHLQWETTPVHPVHLADAVAMAGRAAHASSRRRGVVLLLGDGTEDHSEYSVATVRSYLRDLRVPLYVWSTVSDEPHPEWGPVTYVGSRDRPGSTHRLAKAVETLDNDLQRQRVVWIQGRYLPQEITLSDDVASLAFAGAEEESTLAAPLVARPPAAPLGGFKREKTVSSPLDPPKGTPVLIRLEAGSKLPPADKMAGWFVHRGEPVEVLESEQGAARVTILRDPVLQAHFDLMADVFYKRTLAELKSPANMRSAKQKIEPLTGELRQRWVFLDPQALPGIQGLGVEQAQNHLRFVATLGRDTEVSFLNPITGPPGRVGSDRGLFWRDGIHIADGAGMLFFLEGTNWHPGEVCYAEALMGSARDLAEEPLRRAVVLMLGPEREDRSRISLERARGELERLGVPLYVWSAERFEPHRFWGEVRPAGWDPEKYELYFTTAAKELREHLAAQRIVWLRGRYQPGTIELGEVARGVRLVGGVVPMPES